MPHVHSMTIFDVDRIEIAWDADCSAYSISLFEGERELPTTKINIWRGAAAGRPELRLEGLTIAGKQEDSDALDAHNEESDR